MGNLPSAIPSALEVFNLQDDLWPAKLSAKRQQELVRRIEARVGMTDLEVSYLMPRNWKPLPKRPSKKEAQDVRRFILEYSLGSSGL